MARTLNRLSPRAAATISTPGRHADGGNLFLVVGPGASRRWAFIYRARGKLREMGLGGFKNVPLGKAREQAKAAREQLAANVDPIEARKASSEMPTFGSFADQVVKDLGPQWRNAKHRAQWASTLETDAAKLRPIRINQIGTNDVLECLKALWTEKPETGSRLRGRIERVLDAAKVKGFRIGENPARWRGHLDHLLPKRQKLARGHHAALPYAVLPEFLAQLHQRKGMAALALEFLILTAARSGEVRGARWIEMDMAGKVWTVPANRMKAGREHRVPLSTPALAILEKMLVLTNGVPDALVFTGLKPGAALSDATFKALLVRMGVEPTTATPHGFRSSFRDWAGEVSTFPRELAEVALAHVVGDATERAYRRGDALEKRRGLMDGWADFCARNTKTEAEHGPAVEP